MQIDDVVQFKGAATRQGRVVGVVETSEGRRVLVRWAEAWIFPNPTLERADALEIVRRAPAQPTGDGRLS